MNFKKVYSNKGECLSGLLRIYPKLLHDSRGFFKESWNKKNWDEALKSQNQLPKSFVQDNHSRSKKGTLRGLHYQVDPHPQGKLVSCINGKIYDVAVDLRQDSETFGKWAGLELSSENNIQFWIPSGFAHGFLTLSKQADVVYKVNEYWDKSSERSLNWNDKKLDINWPKDYLNETKVELSNKDRSAPFLDEISNEDLF
jgi:dTDP-4-dehydrorhamnose 3,5-epimerase